MAPVLYKLANATAEKFINLAYNSALLWSKEKLNILSILPVQQCNHAWVKNECEEYLYRNILWQIYQCHHEKNSKVL